MLERIHLTVIQAVDHYGSLTAAARQLGLVAVDLPQES